MGLYSTRDIVITITAPAKELVIKDLHIDVEIIKTLSATPNVANLTVFGLAKSSRDFLTAIYDEDNAEYNVKIEIDNNTLYSGDLVNVSTVFNLTEWETKLYANEGYNAFRKTAKVETKKGDTRSDVLNSMFDTLTGVGLSAFDVQAMKNTCGNKSILKRVLYDGNVIDNIKNLIKDCLPSTDVFIDNGKLNILKKDSAIEKTTVLTNFLAPPQLNEQGCRATMQTNTDIQIGAKVQLQAKSYSQSFGNLSTNRAKKSAFSGEGSYKVTELVHKFDNYTASVAITEITGIFLI